MSSLVLVLINQVIPLLASSFLFSIIRAVAFCTFIDLKIYSKKSPSKNIERNTEKNIEKQDKKNFW